MLENMTEQAFKQAYKYSSIARILSPAYPTHIAIMLYTLLGGIIAGVLSLIDGMTLSEAALAGFLTGAAVFIAWVITRELTPDDEMAAFLSSTFALISALILDPPHILALGATILLMRIVNRTVGPPAKTADVILALAATVAVIFSGQWSFGGAAIFAFFLNTTLLPNPQKYHVAAIIVTISAMSTYLVLNTPLVSGDLTWPFVFVAIVTNVIFVGTVIIMREVKSLTDVEGYTLHLRRVQGGMFVALLAAVLMMWHGDNGVMFMAPLWASLLGTAIFRIFNLQTDQVSIVRSGEEQ